VVENIEFPLYYQGREEEESSRDRAGLAARVGLNPAGAQTVRAFWRHSNASQLLGHW